MVLLLNFRFSFTTDRVKIYTNQEKTRWVSLLCPKLLPEKDSLQLRLEGAFSVSFLGLFVF